MGVTGKPLQRLAAAGLAEVALVGSTSGSQDGRQFVFLGLSNAGEHPLLVSGTLKLADGWGVVVQDLRWSGAELPPLGSLSHAVPLAGEPLARGDYRATMTLTDGRDTLVQNFKLHFTPDRIAAESQPQALVPGAHSPSPDAGLAFSLPSSALALRWLFSTIEWEKVLIIPLMFLILSLWRHLRKRRVARHVQLDERAPVLLEAWSSRARESVTAAEEHSATDPPGQPPSGDEAGASAGELVAAGQRAARAGDPVGARRHFLAAISLEPTNETAWVWLAATVAPIEDKVRCLEHVLRINPGNRNAREGLRELVPSDTPA